MNQLATTKNELAVFLEQPKPKLIQIREQGRRLKDLNVQQVDDLTKDIFLILGIVEKSEDQMNLRKLIAVEALKTLKANFSTFTDLEIIEAYRLSASNKLPLKHKIRTFDSNSVGDVMEAFRIYRAKETKVYRKKEQDLRIEHAEKQKIIEVKAMEIKEVVRWSFENFKKTGELGRWFYLRHFDMWRFLFEGKNKNMRPYRAEASRIANSEMFKKINLSQKPDKRAIEIKMAELSIIDYFKTL